MKKIAICTAAIVGLSGCMAPIKITSEPVAASLTSPALQERLSPNTMKMTVRAFTPKTDEAPGAEVAGAKCTLVSDELRATVITPQEVILPRFKQRAAAENRGLPGSLVITCTAGELKGKSIVTAQAKQVGTAVNAGLGAAILTTLVTAAVATATPWQYPAAISVGMTE
ncbi:MAG: hypothetical protein ABJL99_18515 [Aliishimia sp.]